MEKVHFSSKLTVKQSCLPVTSLEFVSVGHAEVLLAGEGPYLKALSKGGLLHAKEEVLPFRRVHGIRPAPDSLSMKKERPVCVFGQKVLRLIRFQKTEDSQFRLLPLTDMIEASDWILDVYWLSFADSANFSLSYVSSHNTVTVYSVTGGAVSTDVVHSEVSCILYSAQLLSQTTADTLVVVSGTVFNQILLWTVDIADPSTSTDPSTADPSTSTDPSTADPSTTTDPSTADPSTTTDPSTADPSTTTDPSTTKPSTRDTTDPSAADPSTRDSTDPSTADPSTTNPSSRVPVRLSLSGHEGVIFSVRLSECTLLSVSDDRTVRLWTLPQDWKAHTCVELRECDLVLYGHTARVWDARLLPEVIVSVGEDATCRVWDYSGRMMTKVEGHKGRSIWSLAVDSENKMVATGGGDCSVRMFSLDGGQEWSCDSHLTSNDIPRTVCLYGNTAFCHTDKGVLYAAHLSPFSDWKEVCRDEAFSGYCVSTLSVDTGMLCLGNLKGLVKLVCLDEQGTVLEDTCWSAHAGKVFSLSWSTLREGGQQELLLSCGPEGELKCWRCQAAQAGGAVAVTLLTTLTLPPSKHRWISAILTFTDDTLVLGDRRGSLHVYKTQLDPSPDRPPSEPVFSCRAHGPNGVSCVKVCGGCVCSAGRDGYCRRYDLSQDGHLTQLSQYKPVKGMDWMEDVFFLEDDTLVLGFHTTDMVLYSTAQNRHVVRIKCGGGHRSYGISSLKETLCAVFIKQSGLCLRTSCLDAYFTPPILQPAFVGREAISLEILGCVCTGELLLAAGSEDCSVCLMAVSPHSLCLRVVKTLTGHLSSVKALASIRGKGGVVLFSGGARASLKAWQIPLVSSLLCGGGEVRQCGEVFLHNKQHSRRKKPTDTPECRVMSLACLERGAWHYLAAGCSDGLIRQFMFTEDNGVFRSCPSLEYHDYCVLCVKCHTLSHPHTSTPHPLLFSSATDGGVAVWSLASQLESWSTEDQTADQLVPQPVLVFKAHQSGVNDIIVSCQGGGHLCVVTGGDDNAVTVSHLMVSTTTQLPRVTLDCQYSVPNAHSSSITGVGWLSANVVVSTSVDQRLNVWRVDPHSQHLSLCSSHTHDVADVAALKVHPVSEGKALVVLCGIGLQCSQLEIDH